MNWRVAACSALAVILLYLASIFGRGTIEPVGISRPSLEVLAGPAFLLGATVAGVLGLVLATRSGPRGARSFLAGVVLGAVGVLVLIGVLLELCCGSTG